MSGGSLTKAYLQIEKGDRIECWFNPRELSITKANTWTTPAVVGTDVPAAQFGGGQPRKLTLELLFDRSHVGGDVREATDALFEAMNSRKELASGKNSARPPTIEFGWGALSTFKAVADQLTVRYTMFAPDGRPIRAQVTLALTQVEKAVGGKKGQNPTTRGIEGIRSHVLRDGDTLQSVAFTMYGDPTRWRTIAEANGIDDPLRLRRGTVLSIPRLPE